MLPLMNVCWKICATKNLQFKAAETSADDALKDCADKEDTVKQEVPPLSPEDSDLFGKVLERVKEILGDRVKEVRISHKLSDSLAVEVSPKGMTNNMDKFLRLMQKDDTLPVRDFKLKKDHPLARHMLRIFKANPLDPILSEMTENLFDACMLLDGYIKEPQQLAQRIRNLLEQSSAWYTEVKKI